jgi:hypothetical protein
MIKQKAIDLLLVILLLYSCQSGTVREKENSVVNNNRPSDSQSPPHLIKETSFLDNLAGKMDLSVAQISRHLQIDSIYYTGVFADALFRGDTVFHLAHGLKGAIVSCDDRRNCIHRFLLIFDPAGKNTDSKIVAADCDRDESAGYTILSYRILNDSSFLTSERYVPPGGSALAQRGEEKVWQVNTEGRFVDMTHLHSD